MKNAIINRQKNNKFYNIYTYVQQIFYPLIIVLMFFGYINFLEKLIKICNSWIKILYIVCAISFYFAKTCRIFSFLKIFMQKLLNSLIYLSYSLHYIHFK